MPEIITKLNELGITHDGTPFTANCVYGILKNKRYTGICEIHGVVYDNIYPRIVPADIMDKVATRLARNKKGRGTKTAPYLLRYKLFCGYCGCPMAGESGTSITGKRSFYYKCYGKKKLNNGCNKEQIRKETLEDIVLTGVIDAIKNTSTLNMMVDKLYELQSDQKVTNPAMSSLLEDKAKTDKALNNLVAAIENGLMSNTTNKRLQELEQHPKELETKIAIEKSKQKIVFSKEGLKAFYLDSLKESPQILIENVVKKVVLYDDSVTIYFNNPIAESLDERQGFLLYEKKHNYTIKRFRYDQTTPRPIDIQIRL